ncbi:MAG: helix-turn-helix domain-containing protein [Chloroflexota bacterium]
MTRVVNKSRRSYRSALRDRQAGETRERILDAVVRVMARGVADLSIPAVAREADVSARTVYRHFASKRELLAELQPYFARRTGMDTVPPPRSIDELHHSVRTLFTRIHEMGPVGYAALASPVGSKTRHAQMPARRRSIRDGVDAIGPGMSNEWRERLARLVAVLTSSASLRMWTEHLGLTPDDASDDVAAVIRAVVAGAT